MQQVNLGMIGGGTVGSGVFHAWQKNGSLMAARLGVKLVIRKIAVKAFDEPRPYPIPRSLMTTDWQEVVNDSANPRRHRTRRRHRHRPDDDSGRARTGQAGRHREQGAALRARRRSCLPPPTKYGANLYYEASVCGGIPIIKSLREGFVANRIHRALRHRQRHLQLHPHPHETGGRGFRRRARRRAKAGLRRNAAGPGH